MGLVRGVVLGCVAIAVATSGCASLPGKGGPGVATGVVATQPGVLSQPGQGTTVKASFRRSHPDRKPLGDMLETIRMIVAARPDLEFKYEQRIDDSVYRFDTTDMSRDEARGPI